MDKPAGENAIVSAGKKITGWTLFDSTKNIWRANVGTGWNFHQLFVNGLHATRARGSLFLSLPAGTGGFTRTSTGFMTSTSMATFGNQTDIEIVGQGNFFMDRCKVQSISSSTITVQQPCWRNVLPSVTRAPPFAGIGEWGFWIENAYELLTSPGQWYLNRTNGFVYYSPRPGEDMSTVPVFAPNLDFIMTGVNVSNVQFNNLTFSYGNWTGFDNADGYNGQQDGQYLINGVWFAFHTPIYFSTSHNMVFSHDRFAYNGSRVLMYDKGSDHISVLANVFTENAGGGLQFGRYPEDDMFNNITHDITIQDNRSLNNDFDYGDLSSAFYTHGTTNTNITHNEMSESPWMTVEMAGGSATILQNNKMTFNYVHNYCLVYWDCAGLYTFVARGPQGVNVLVDSNNIDGAVWTNVACLYSDEGSAWETWSNNVCQNYKLDAVLTNGGVPVTNHDNTIAGNFSDKSFTFTDFGTNNHYTNNTSFTPGSPPPAVENIIDGAGITAGVIPGPQ